MVTPIHYKISYAQNYEDLVLSGLLRDIKAGFYVDLGANHPELDSVTKIFYERNWSGINVEPSDVLHAKLCDARPRDTNLNVGVSSQQGILTFRAYQSLDGLSTFSSQAMEYMDSAWPDAKFVEKPLKVTTLREIFAEHKPTGEIHFLKIDIEGLELEALLGNSWSRYRPWVLCIEQAHDTEDAAARREAITTCLRVWDYSKVFFDGINEYFVAKEHYSLWENFSYARDVVLGGVRVNYIFINHIAEILNEVKKA